jgi:hypothetical protein
LTTLASFQTERTMSKNEFYYLLLVCMAFGGFGLSLGAACFKYRSWNRQEVRVKSRK